jgi:PmbA protein
MKSQKIRAEALLEKLAKQTDGAEIYELRTVELPVRFRAGALESVKAVETAGRALRLIKDGRLGFSTTTDLGDDTYLVPERARICSLWRSCALSLSAQQPAPSVQCFDPQVEQMDEQSFIALGEQIVEKIKAYDATLQINVGLSKELEEVSLYNTSGLALTSRRTLLSVSVSATRAREGDIFTIFEATSWRQAKEIDGLALAERLIERLRLAEESCPSRPKRCP